MEIFLITLTYLKIDILLELLRSFAAIIIGLPVADPIKFSGGKSFPTEKAKRRTQNPVREGRGEGVSSQILTIKMGSINSININ